MIRKLLLRLFCIGLVCISLLLPGDARAGSSIFSGLGGYGIFNNVSSSRAIGLGGAGIALSDSVALNFLNPALLGCLQKTRVSMGGYFADHRMEDSYASDAENWAQFEYFALAIALKRGLGLGFFLTPASRIDYRYNWNVSNWGSTFNESLQGTGGLSRAALNLGWAFAKWGKIGGGLYTAWGEVEESRISYTETSGYDYYIEFLSTKQWLGFGGTAGLVLQPLSELTLGFTFEPEVPITLDKTFSYSENDSTVVGENEYRLAARYGLSAAFQFAPNWLAAGQVIYSPWGDTNELPASLYGYQNSYEISAGAEWIPGSWDSDHFMTRMEYRFGFRMEDGYLLGEDKSSIRGYYGAIGLGYPFHKGRDRFDLAVEFGLRGDLSSNGGQESMLKIHMGLNFGELWFQRPKPSWED